MHEQIKVLDHGYVRLVETWGHGDKGARVRADETDDGFVQDNECGIIEAARQSTQAAFRGWEDTVCPQCGGRVDPDRPTLKAPGVVCEPCAGKGYLPGDARLLAYLFNNRHSTPFEFAGMTIEVQAPIMVFREWHRHRTQSYNEMSARYEPLPDLNYVPTVERLMLNAGGSNKQAGTVKGAGQLTREDAEGWLDKLCASYAYCEQIYQMGLKSGVPKELARLVLPVGRYSRMRATANLRNWLAFCTLRMDPAAQWEIRMYANAVGSVIEAQFPQTWNLFRKTLKEAV